MTLKTTLFFVSLFLCTSLALAQDAVLVPNEEVDLPVPANKDSADAANPGMPYLDLATEEKLKAKLPADLGKVIGLCRKAEKEGLSGENLTYCHQLRASAQLQRGLLAAQQLIGKPKEQMPADWEAVTLKTLADLEEAVKIMKDQPLPFLRIAQLQKILPNGDTKRAAAALDEALAAAKGDQITFTQVLTLKASMEGDPKKREEIIANGIRDNANPHLLLLHALALIDLKQLDKASEELHKILEQEPGNERAFDLALGLLCDQGKFDDALKLLDTVDKGSKNTENILKRVQILTQMGKQSDAVKYLDQLREQQPENIRILHLRSLIHFDNKDYDNALKDIEAAIRIEPNNGLYLFHKARILAVSEREDDAVKILNDILQNEPQNIEAALLKIQILSSRKKVDEAVAVVETLEKQQPNNERWMMLKISVYADGDKFDKALELVDKWIKEKPDDEKRQILKAQIYVDKKDYDKARSIAEELHKKYPDKDNITVLLIGILSSQKKNKEAVKLMEPLLKKEPENIAFLRVQSQLLISTNQHNEAIKMLEKIIKIVPKDETSINNLSWILSTSPVDIVRDGKRALELALKASELTGYKKAYILSTLAAAYAETGDFDKAVEWSLKSIDLSKDDENVSERIEDLQKELDSYKNKKPFREAINE
ncbi:MAG: tetratricopeptide repeat protein [Planctomycetaceae bacterium]|jgi:tetratricopeptide (TPR) repeat protein|nr:tetratricopeptide repeat protein [Planctomycetaceae bacterium]